MAAGIFFLLGSNAVVNSGAGFSTSTSSSGTALFPQNSYFVNATAYLNNGSFILGNVNYYSTIPGPESLFYSNITGKIYVSSNISSIYMINPQTISSTFNDIGSYFPTSLNLIEKYGSLFMLSGQNNLTLWNLTSKNITNISVGSYPQGMAYDPSASTVFVTVQGPDSLVAVNLTSMKVSAKVPLRFGPFGIEYDIENGLLYLSYPGAGLISVYNPSSMKFVANITAGGSPYEFAAVPSQDKIFVSDNGLNCIDIINTNTQQIEKYVAVGYMPTGITFDNKTGDVAVANTDSYNITFLNAKSEDVIQNLAVGSQPYSIVSDSKNGMIAVGNHGSNSISFVQPVTNYLVVFHEKGLPIGSLWSVSANGVQRSSNTQNISFDEKGGQMNYTASPQVGYYGTMSGSMYISQNSVLNIAYHSVSALHNEILLLTIFIAVVVTVAGAWFYFGRRKR